MPLANIKELKPVSNAGLYCISSEPPCNKETNFKLGRTIDFKNRLNSYHLCYNKGFHIYCVLPLSKKYNLVGTDNRKVAKDFTRVLEKKLFEKLKDYNKTYTTRRKSEWYRCVKKRVSKALNEIHEEYPDDTDKPITEWEDDFIDEFVVDGFDEKINTQDKPLSYLPQSGYKTKSGRIVVSTKDTKFKDMKYLNSDKIYTSPWQKHVAEFKKLHPKINHTQATKQAKLTYKKVATM